MRKLLLASAAVIGGVAGGQVMAQTVVNTAVPLPPTWTEAPIPTQPHSISGANSNLSGQGFYTKGPLPAPTPGSVVVRFNGRVVFYGFAQNSSAQSITTFVDGKAVASRKSQPYGTIGYARFYQGVDGLTTSGLRYGASVEIRVSTSTAKASTTSGGASGATSGSSTAPGQTLYVRRAFAYIGGDNWGAVHFGQDDGPMGLMEGGVTTFQTYNDGGWNDDLNDIGNPSTPVFPFPTGIGNEYTTSKVVYLSPQIAGFDFAASFEPDDNPLNDSIADATAGSPQLSTGLTADEIARRRNTYEAAARYQGNFGPAGIYAMAGYMGSGQVTRGIGAPSTNYNNLGILMTGIAVNFGGFRVGGNFTTGQVNNQVGLKVDGGANMVAYIVGAQYTAGPMTVGASYLNVLSQGATGPTSPSNPNGLLGSQRREGGINVGGTYVVAPGLLGWLSATYGQRYQGGWNFGTGTVGPGANNVKFTAIALGGMVRW
ncbi:MAG TPA: porin [Acetobacteraceae bacterium]